MTVQTNRTTQPHGLNYETLFESMETKKDEHLGYLRFGNPVSFRYLSPCYGYDCDCGPEYTYYTQRELNENINNFKNLASRCDKCCVQIIGTSWACSCNYCCSILTCGLISLIAPLITLPCYLTYLPFQINERSTHFAAASRIDQIRQNFIEQQERATSKQFDPNILIPQSNIPQISEYLDNKSLARLNFAQIRPLYLTNRTLFDRYTILDETTSLNNHNLSNEWLLWKEIAQILKYNKDEWSTYLDRTSIDRLSQDNTQFFDALVQLVGEEHYHNANIAERFHKIIRDIYSKKNLVLSEKTTEAHLILTRIRGGESLQSIIDTAINTALKTINPHKPETIEFTPITLTFDSVNCCDKKISYDELIAKYDDFKEFAGLVQNDLNDKSLTICGDTKKQALEILTLCHSAQEEILELKHCLEHNKTPYQVNLERKLRAYFTAHNKLDITEFTVITYNKWLDIFTFKEKSIDGDQLLQFAEINPTKLSPADFEKLYFLCKLSDQYKSELDKIILKLINQKLCNDSSNIDLNDYIDYLSKFLPIYNSRNLKTKKLSFSANAFRLLADWALNTKIDDKNETSLQMILTDQLRRFTLDNPKSVEKFYIGQGHKCPTLVDCWINEAIAAKK